MISPELLRRFALFSGLPPQVIAEIAQFGEEETLEVDTYLFEQAEQANELYLILEGTVDLLMDIDETGKMRTEVETLVTGEIIGWSALVEPHEYRLSAVVTSEAKVITISAVSLRGYMISKPEYGYSIMCQIARIIGERLNHMRTRFISMIE